MKKPDLTLEKIAAQYKVSNIKKKEYKSVVSLQFAQKFYMKGHLSKTALKIFHILIAEAGDKQSSDDYNNVSLLTLNKILKSKLTEKRLQIFLTELTTVNVVFNQPPNYGSSPVLAHFDIYHETPYSKYVIIKYDFGKHFKESVKENRQWAMLDVLAIANFKSKYSIDLYVILSSWKKLDFRRSYPTTFSGLRSVLGIPFQSYQTNYKIIYKILLPAIAEIESTNEMQIQLHYSKIGRNYADNITLSWETPNHRKNEVLDHLKNNTNEIDF